jgi:hypothetical protein
MPVSQGRRRNLVTQGPAQPGETFKIAGQHGDGQSSAVGACLSATTGTPIGSTSRVPPLLA